LTRWRGWLPTLLADRRGATAMTFAVSFLAFLGLVGLATEAGSWYVGLIEAQNASDAAALAGARAAADANAAWANSPINGGTCVLTSCGDPMQRAANAAASDTAQRNGYSNTGSNGGFNYAVRTPTPLSSLSDALSQSQPAGVHAWLVNEVQISVAVTKT
jgi:Flp pilus assembly protein TadG